MKNKIFQLKELPLMQSKYDSRKYKTITDESTQNLWCRDEMWKHVIESIGRPVDTIFTQRNGCTLRCCNKSASECRGAHSLNNLKILPHIERYNNLDKSKFNWIKLYLNILKTMEKDITQLKKEDHKSLIKNLNSMNFIELIQLWREMACYYNKTARELPYKKDSGGQENVHECGFTYRDDVPLFKIGDGLEEHSWAFVRLIRFCDLNKKFEESIKSGNLITIWDLCLATGLNCKGGVHKKSEIVCIDDFLTGKCSCLSIEQLETQEIELSQKLIELSNQLVSLIENKNGKKNKQKDNRVVLHQQIISLENQIKDLQSSRSIHYTELGMKPFNQQYEEYQLEIKKSEDKPKVKKNDDIKIGLISGPVIKVTKFGKK